MRDLTTMIGGVSSNNNRGDGNDGRGTGGGDLMDTGVQRYINERKDRAPVTCSPMVKEIRKRDSTIKDIHRSSVDGGRHTIMPRPAGPRPQACRLNMSDKVDREHGSLLEKTVKKEVFIDLTEENDRVKQLKKSETLKDSYSTSTVPPSLVSLCLSSNLTITRSPMKSRSSTGSTSKSPITVSCLSNCDIDKEKVKTQPRSATRSFTPKALDEADTFKFLSPNDLLVDDKT